MQSIDSIVLKDSEESKSVNIMDLKNGKYLVTYIVKNPGKYRIDVEFVGTYQGNAGYLRGSGCIVDFFNSPSPFGLPKNLASSMARTTRENNKILGDLTVKAVQTIITRLNSQVDSLKKTIIIRVKDESWSVEEHIRVLISVKEAIVRDVISSIDSSKLLIEQMECMLEFYRENNVQTILPYQDELINVKSSWDSLISETPGILSKILPIMKGYSSKIKNEIQNYETFTKSYISEIKQQDFFNFATGAAKALNLIEIAELEHNKQIESYYRMEKISNVFEIGQDIMQSCKHVILFEITEILKDFKLLWETFQNVRGVIENCNAMTWSKLDTEVIDDISRSIVSSLRKLPRSVKSSNAFRGFDKVVKEFVVTCPVVVSLRSPTMRSRHWLELMSVVKKTFELPSENPKMKFYDLFKLSLHEYAVEIEEIAEKARKEAKHEEILASLEQTWSNVTFSMSKYKDSEITLIKLDDEVIEQLESDQMSVQSIVGTRYNHFKPKAIQWQVTLSLISDVSAALSDIIRSWSYLEPLFISSEEVKKELPQDTLRFSKVDRNVREILAKAWKLKLVKTACLQEGLLDRLLSLQKEQESCKKSLSEYLDSKRKQFPRFYFISEADLLDILSNSSQPVRVLRHIDKILLFTKEVSLETVENFNSPKASKRNQPTDKISSTTVPNMPSVMTVATKFTASVGNEIVVFEPPLKITGKAEQYLKVLLYAQLYTLSKCLKSSMARYPEMVRCEWLLHKTSVNKKSNSNSSLLTSNPTSNENNSTATNRDYTLTSTSPAGENINAEKVVETGLEISVDPAQIALLVSHIDFVRRTEKALQNSTSSGILVRTFETSKSQLADLIALTRRPLSSGDRQRVMCMITIDAHNRDILDQLIKEHVNSISDFQWQSKLRPSFIPDPSNMAASSIKSPSNSGGAIAGNLVSSAEFRICDASFDYGFEYLGNGARLVVTPLTDRIYVTATLALNLKMGCAPSGPAGTGKTETTKDLAAALGKCCYVFNCSPEMDYQSMGNIFKGLSSSGSWGCFDEFNRLIPEVLSVCSVQFKAVCDGLRAYDAFSKLTQTVTIEGDTVSLDITMGAFITMNPGYLGRSELPEGLKTLFRPITVMVLSY